MLNAHTSPSQDVDAEHGKVLLTFWVNVAGGTYITPPALSPHGYIPNQFYAEFLNRIFLTLPSTLLCLNKCAQCEYIFYVDTHNTIGLSHSYVLRRTVF